jgi:hypothetical protein
VPPDVRAEPRSRPGTAQRGANLAGILWSLQSTTIVR